MILINKTTHEVEGINGATENWYDDGWAIVPEELEQMAIKSCGFCELVFDDGGNLIDIILTEKPEPSTPEPTEAEDTAAMLVDHEYRLTLLELGITEEV